MTRITDATKNPKYSCSIERQQQLDRSAYIYQKYLALGQEDKAIVDRVSTFLNETQKNVGIQGALELIYMTMTWHSSKKII